nr:DNA-directed RNA polymerases I, II [Kaumoebavirus]
MSDYEEIFDIEDVDEDLEEADDLDENIEVEGEEDDVVAEVEDLPVLPEETEIPLHTLPMDKRYKRVIVLPKNKRKTSSTMTLFEYAEVTGMRAKQIEQNSPIFIDYTAAGLGDASALNPIDIARAELRAKRNPLMLQRVLSETATEKIVEWWEVNELNLPPL